MKKFLLYTGFVLVCLSSYAQLGAFNDYYWGGGGNNWIHNPSGNIWDYRYNNYNYNRTNYQRLLTYNYNGFFYNNDGFNLTINTPWGGGNISFPVNTIRQNDTYVYTTPRRLRNQYINNNRVINEIDYSDPDLAMNRVSSSTTEVYTRTMRWVMKKIPVEVRISTRTDSNGSVFYKTDIIEQDVLVLE